MTALRSGYTTGACAAAATKGAALLLRDGAAPDAVTIILPTGDSASFTLHNSQHTAAEAICSVIKDAGDDPDITNGAEVVVTVTANGRESGVVIEGGCGIGRVTKPGLALLPGEWAINPVPRRMIEQAVREILPGGSYRVVISIPDGEERAKKTLNARLGIIGGLSILGTTGIVRPISAKAWTDTIDAALNVARACGCRTVVLCTGRTSELAAMKYFATNPTPLPEEAFIMMGDHIAYALQSCHSHGFLRPALACQFGKLLKIACGHPNTHAAASTIDLSRLRKWIETAGLSGNLISLVSGANTAREIAIASGYDPLLLNLVCGKARAAIQIHAPSLDPALLVCGYDNAVVLEQQTILHGK